MGGGGRKDIHMYIYMCTQYSDTLTVLIAASSNGFQGSCVCGK